jgi:AraC-like DNA-binding protein
MDALSQVVEFTRRGRAQSARIEIRSPWAFRGPEETGAAFYVVLQGACWLVPADGHAPLSLGPGDVVLLPRGARHVIADDPRTPPVEPSCVGGQGSVNSLDAGGRNGARSVLLSGGYLLDRERSHPLLAALPEVLHVPADPGSNHSLRAAITLLGDELESGRPGAGAVIPALVDALLPLIVRAWLDTDPVCDEGDWRGAFTDPGIADALERIHAEPNRAWTVASLASAVGLSRAAFARRFARAVGEPPLTYLANWRMTLAARLLRETDLKIAAVARQVGYTSEFAFAKAFKRDYGIAPGAYRRQAPKDGAEPHALESKEAARERR